MPGATQQGTATTRETQNQRQDPWAPAQPAVMAAVNAAHGAFNAGVGSQVYGGQRNAGLGATTGVGLDYLASNVAEGDNVARAGSATLGSLLGNGGTTAGTRAATDRFGAIDPTVSTGGLARAAGALSDPNGIGLATGTRLANGGYETDTRTMQGLAERMATGGTQTQRSLQAVADGAYLGGANPYADAAIGRATAAAASRVGQQFAAAGRYGSGRYAAATADALAGIEGQMRYQDYENERARQVQAATAIDSADNARASTAGGLFGQLTNMNQANAGLAVTGANLAQGAMRDSLAGQQTLFQADTLNRERALNQAGSLMGAAQGDRAASMASIGLIDQNTRNLQAPGQTWLQVGAIQDAARQQDLDAARAVFDERQQEPWRQVGLLSGVAFPAAGLGGTAVTNTTRQTPTASPLQQALGFALAGANTASRFVTPGR